MQCSKLAEFEALAKEAKEKKETMPRYLKSFGGGDEYYDDHTALSIAQILESGVCPKNLTLYFQYIAITNKGYTALSNALASGHCPEGLTLQLNGAASAIKMAHALKSGKCPDSLELDYSFDPSIGHSGVAALADALISGNCPTGLSFNFYRLGGHEEKSTQLQKLDDYVSLLSDALKSGHCPQGLSLKLTSVPLSIGAVRLLADALASGHCPENLNLIFGSNDMGDEGMSLIAEAIKTGRCPKGMRLLLSDMSDESVLNFASALPHAPKGMEIQLSSINSQEQKGAIEFANVLKKGQAPQELKFQLNYYSRENYSDDTSEASNAFAEALKSGNCPKGLQLNLNCREWKSSTTAAFTDALKSGKCPENLSLNFDNSHNNEDVARNVLRVLKSGCCPRGLALTLWAEGSLSADLVSEALQSGKCPTGLTLKLHSGFVGKNLDQEMVTLAKALESKNCPSHLHLHLIVCSMTEKGIDAFIHLVESNRYPLGLQIKIEDTASRFNPKVEQRIEKLENLLRAKEIKEASLALATMQQSVLPPDTILNLIPFLLENTPKETHHLVTNITKVASGLWQQLPTAQAKTMDAKNKPEQTESKKAGKSSGA